MQHARLARQSIFTRPTLFRHVSQKPNVRILGEQQGPKASGRSWAMTANRISNFAIIPFALMYAVFFADFGEREHVFSPARRWLQQQKAAFFSLSPEEQELVAASSDEAGVGNTQPSQ